MKIIKTSLPGVLIIQPKVFGDQRGYFFESYQRQRYAEQGIDVEFVQDNISHSQQGVLRGLHYQLPHTQGKLVWVSHGAVFDVAVDVRIGSPTFGKATYLTLDAANHQQLYVPPGFAHGFCTLTDNVGFHYKCSNYYAPDCEFTIRWDDPDLDIPWPISDPTLSPKDTNKPTLKDIPVDSLPKYEDFS